MSTCHECEKTDVSTWDSICYPCILRREYPDMKVNTSLRNEPVKLKKPGKKLFTLG